AEKGRGAEVLHQHDLPFGHSGAGWDDCASDAACSLVKSEAAGEKPISISDLDDIFLSHCRRPEHPGYTLRPLLEVFGGIWSRNGFAGRSGGTVYANHFFHGNGAKHEGIIVPQIVFHCKGKFSDMIHGL